MVILFTLSRWASCLSPTYVTIQKPESLLNREQSEDSISRERAKLLIEILKEDDPEKRVDGLTIIKEVYGDQNSKWANKKIEDALLAKAMKEIKVQHLYKYRELDEERLGLEEELFHNPGQFTEKEEEKMRSRLDEIDKKINEL